MKGGKGGGKGKPKTREEIDSRVCFDFQKTGRCARHNCYFLHEGPPAAAMAAEAGEEEEEPTDEGAVAAYRAEPNLKPGVWSRVRRWGDKLGCREPPR